MTTHFHLFLSIITGAEIDLEKWIESWKFRVKEKDKRKELEREEKIKNKGVVPSRAGLIFFSFFNSPSLANISLVNKRLRQIACHDLLWRPRCIVKWTELELATRVEDDPFPAWKSCYTRRINVKETELKDIMQDRELSRCDWYTCSQGHLYMIGECRLPMFLAKCPTCGERIGGRHHTMESSNKRVGAVYKEGLMNKKISVDDVQTFVAGTPSTAKRMQLDSSDERKQKRQADYGIREEKSMNDLQRWLTSGTRSDESVIAKVERTKYLDALSTFRILLPFFGGTLTSKTDTNEMEIDTNEISKPILAHANTLFAQFAKTLGDQNVLIGALEEYCSKSPDKFALFSIIIRGFHRAGALSSKSLKQWFSASSQSSWLVEKTIAIGYRTHLKSFITPLF